MPQFPNMVDRISARAARGVTITLTVLFFTVMLLLGLAHYKLATMQQDLTPLITQELRQTLGRDVRIGSAHLTGLDSVQIDNAAIAKGGTFGAGTAMSAAKITARINLLKFALQQGQNPAGAIQQVVLQQPVFDVGRSQDGQWDFQDLVDRINSRQSMGKMHAQLIINDGKVNYNDSRGFSAKPESIHQQLVGISARFTPTGGDNYSFNVAAADAENRLGEMKLAGDYSQHSGVANISVSAKKVVVKELARYLPKPLPITFEDGTAAFRLSALFRHLPNPAVAHTLPTTALTAEVNLAGVGLRLDEMSAPVMASSGTLRLVHDPARYPKGSRLDLIDVQAHADDLPIAISGTIGDLNLFDIAHLNPNFDVRIQTATDDGSKIARLFPKTPWLGALHLQGPLSLQATAKGHHTDLEIAGTVQSDQFQVETFHGTGVSASFTLHPGTGGHGNEPSILAVAHLQHGQRGVTDISDVQVTASSYTPWRQLSDALLVNGTANAKGVHTPWGDLSNITDSFSATTSMVSMHDVHADLYGGHVSGDIAMPYTARPDQPSVSVNAAYTGIDLKQLAGMLHISDLAGTGDGKLNLSVQSDGGIAMKDETTGTNVTYRNYHASAVNLALQSLTKDNVTEVTIPSATAQTDYGTITIAHGSYHVQGAAVLDGALNLPVQFAKVPLELLASQIAGIGNMQGTLTGSLDHPALVGNFSVENGSVLGRTFTHGQGELSLQGTSLHVRNISLSRPGATLTVAGGPDGFDPRQGFQHIPVAVTLNGMPFRDLLEAIGQKIPWTIDGATFGSIVLQLTPNGTVASGTVEIPQPVVHIPAGKRIYPLALDQMALQFDVNGRTMQFRKLTVQRGNTTTEATGSAMSQIGEPLQAHLDFHSDKALLEDLPQDLLGVPVALSGPSSIQGTLDGVLNGTGPQPLTVNVTANSSQATVDGVPNSTGHVDLTYRYRPQDRELTINSGEITNAGIHATSTGDYLLSDHTIRDAKVTVDHFDLTTLKSLAVKSAEGGRTAEAKSLIRALPAGFAGQGAIGIGLSGDIHQPTVTLDMNVTNLAFNGTSLPNLNAKLATEFIGNKYALRILQATAQGGSGEGTAQFNGLIAPGEKLDLNYSAQDLTAKLLSTWSGTLPIDGRTSMDGHISGTVQSPVVDGNLLVADPIIGGHTFTRVQAHLHLTRDDIAISGGQFLLAPESQPLTFQGSIPWQWDGSRVQYPVSQPLAVDVKMPEQRLSVLRVLAPSLPEMQGTIGGDLKIGGTFSAPRIADGHFQVAGSATLPPMAAAYPNRIDNIDLQVSVNSDGPQSQVSIDHLSAVLDRFDRNGQPVKNFQPGWIAANGTIGIGIDQLLSPDHWQWDVYGKAVRLPLPVDLCLVPNISGFLHIATEDGAPVINGVMLTSDVKIQAPKTTPTTANGMAHWSGFAFNPKLSIVVQVGDRVKIAKSIVRLPLKPTPLPWPDGLQVTPGTQPSLDIDRSAPAFADNADMLHSGTSAELTGSWGTVTGTLNNPQVYARFEVNKNKLAFPFNLFGSIRNARGHVTYSMATGPQITMGIPNFPTPQAKATTPEVSALSQPAAVPAPAP